MGNGSSSGASGSRAERPAYFGESEKAVKLRMSVDYYDREQTRTYDVWFPKSQLSPEGVPTSWIAEQRLNEVRNPNGGGAVVNGFYDKSGKLFKIALNEAEKKKAQKTSKSFSKSMKKILGLK